MHHSPPSHPGLNVITHNSECVTSAGHTSLRPSHHTTTCTMHPKVITNTHRTEYFHVVAYKNSTQRHQYRFGDCQLWKQVFAENEDDITWFLYLTFQDGCKILMIQEKSGWRVATQNYETVSWTLSFFIVFDSFWSNYRCLNLYSSQGLSLIAARTLQWCSDMIFTAPGKLAGLLWPYYDHAPHFHFQLNFSSLHWLKHFLGMHFLFLQGKLHSIVLVTDQSEFSLNITRNIMERPFLPL